MKVGTRVFNYDKKGSYSLKDINEVSGPQNALVIKKNNKRNINDDIFSVGRIKKELRSRSDQRHRLRLLYSDINEDESVTMKKIIETYECTVNDVICNSEDDPHLLGDRCSYNSENYL